MGGLVRQQLGLRRQGQTLEIVPSADVVEALSPERVGRQHGAEPCPQLLQLQVAELVRINP
jgi:hypothetical protein